MSARLDDLHRSFARHLRAEGCADRTITIYGQAITFFSRWLEAQDREATVAEPNGAAIREWLAQLADVNEPSTVKTRYRGLSGSAGWLIDEDELTAVVTTQDFRAEPSQQYWVWWRVLGTHGVARRRPPAEARTHYTSPSMASGPALVPWVRMPSLASP